MILYNTTFLVENVVKENFVKWVKEEHLPNCKELGLLEGQKFFILLNNDEEQASTFCVQYFISSDAHYDEFVSDVDRKTKLRLTKQFGQQLVFFSSTMKEV